MSERGRYGAGSIRQRGSARWELRVNAGRDPSTGRYRQRTMTFTGTEKQARRALAGFVTATENGSARGSDATVADPMHAWLEFARTRVSLTTLRGYRSKVGGRILPALGEIPLRKLSGADLERWYGRLLREDGLAPSHVRQIHAILRNALAQAVRWEMAAQQPRGRGEATQCTEA